MRAHAFSAMGTTWWLGGGGDHPRAEAFVRDVEARLSRFLPDSALSRLNRERCVEDELLARVTRAALRYGEATAGVFDPRLGVELAAAGYDRPFDRIARPARHEARTHLRVQVERARVTLEGDGELDLGGIAKGWTVDRVFELLDGDRLVDGGGDMRAVGEGWTIGVGDDHSIDLDGAAVATSSTLVRRWPLADGGEAHHILDPRTGRPTQGRLVEATVLAPTTTAADVLAKAVLVNPDAILAFLPAFGARALVRDLAGRWWNSVEPLVEVSP